MALVSQIWTVNREDRLRSFLTTNVGAERFVAHLERRGILSYVETIHAYFGDRAEGGSGYEILWKLEVTWDDLLTVFRLL